MTTTTYTRGSLPLLSGPLTDAEIGELANTLHVRGDCDPRYCAVSFNGEGLTACSGWRSESHMDNCMAQVIAIAEGWHDPSDRRVAGFGWMLWGSRDPRVALTWTDGVCQQLAVVAPDLDTARFWLDLLRVYVDHERFFSDLAIADVTTYGA